MPLPLVEKKSQYRTPQDTSTEHEYHTERYVTPQHTSTIIPILHYQTPQP